MKKEIRWLLNELPELEAEGILSAETSRRLHERYSAVSHSRSWALAVFGILGAFLTGLGVISILAANWDDLSKPVRLTMSFVPLCAASGAALWMHLTRRTSAVWQEPIGIFWGLSIGAVISLTAQIYNISGDPESFMLTWMLLLLPVLYATQSRWTLLGYFSGLLSWTMLTDSNKLLFWVLILPALPLVLRLEREKGLTLWLVELGILGVLTAAVGVTLAKVTPGLWIPIYTGLFALGAQLNRKPWPSPAGLFAFGGLSVLFFLLLADTWPWRDIGWNHYRGEEVSPSEYIDYTLALVAPLGAVGICAVNMVRRKFEYLLTGAAPFVTTLCWLAVSKWNRPEIAVWVCTLYMTVFALFFLLKGLRTHTLRLVNAGMALLIGVTWCRFFNTDISFTAKGIVFIVCGLLALTVNFALARRNRHA